MKKISFFELILLLIEKGEIETTLLVPTYIGSIAYKFSPIAGTPVSNKIALTGKINSGEVVLGFLFNKESFETNIKIFDEIPEVEKGSKAQFLSEYLFGAINLLIREKTSMINYIHVGYGKNTPYISSKDFTVDIYSEEKESELLEKLRTL